MKVDTLKRSWWPLRLFMGLALVLGAALYTLPFPLRDIAAAIGVVAIFVYVSFVIKVRPNNLQGVLGASATVLGPALANQFVRLRLPDLERTMEAAGIVVQITFVFIGVVTITLFAIEKQLMRDRVEGLTRVDVTLAFSTAIGVLFVLALLPLSVGSVPEHVLGMPMPGKDAILICRVALALLGVYLTLRPETDHV